jgi:hypothetical protein
MKFKDIYGSYISSKLYNYKFHFKDSDNKTGSFFLLIIEDNFGAHKQAFLNLFAYNAISITLGQRNSHGKQLWNFDCLIVYRE